MFPTHHPSLNQLWSHLLLEELCRWGVAHCCLAPGSRSTPLVMAATQLPQLQQHHHFDERGLGFLALGLAKASATTVAVITTSGSAVANLYPALIEAHHSGVRLVIISADRPPHLHDCGANQSIRQTGMFANYPRARLELPPPSRSLTAGALLMHVDQSMAAIQTETGGVLHINCMFDEPLYPQEPALDFSDYLRELDAWRNHQQPLTQAIEPAPLPLPEACDWQAFVNKPGLIVAGALSDPASAQAVLALATQLGWPVLADIQSQLKFEPAVIGLADLLLCDEAARDLLAQHCHLLQFGGRLVSKRLQAFIDTQPWAAFWVVHPGDYPLAPGRNSSRFFPAPIAPWCHALQRGLLTQQGLLAQRDMLTPRDQPLTPAERPAATAPLAGPETAAGANDPAHLNGYQKQNSLHILNNLQRLNNKRRQRLIEHFESGDALSEPAVAYQVLKAAPLKSRVFAGNSLSIRLLDMVGGNLPASLHLFANRGASGIDGLVATAAGCARLDATPCTLLLGDTSLLYDLNSLALVRDLPGPLAIVVLNNDGGGIFHLLPVPNEQLLREHYQRPHGYHFADACRMFNLAYSRPDTLPAFAALYQQTLAGQQTRIIEVVVDAQQTALAIKQLTQRSTPHHVQGTPTP